MRSLWEWWCPPFPRPDYRRIEELELKLEIGPHAGRTEADRQRVGYIAAENRRMRNIFAIDRARRMRERHGQA